MHACVHLPFFPNHCILSTYISWLFTTEYFFQRIKIFSYIPRIQLSTSVNLTSYSTLIRRRQWHPTPVLLLENPVDGGAWWAAVYGVAQSRTRLKRLHFHFSLSCIGEGNGNPLQCSCLENPRDGGAWWAGVCGVAQSRTRLSSSRSTLIKLACFSFVI